MRLNAFIVVCLLVVASAASATAAAGPYLGVNGGATFFHDSDIESSGYSYYTISPITIRGQVSYKVGGTVGANIGYDFQGFRLEGDYSYRNADTDRVSVYTGRNSGAALSSEVSAHSFMVNGIWDVYPAGRVSPFVGAGIGAIHGVIGDPGDSSTDTVFGYQLFAGVAFKAVDNVFFDLSYRYHAAARDFNDDGASLSYASSNVLGGLRVKF